MAETKTQTTLLPGLSAEMKEYYEKRLIETSEPKLVHSKFGDPYPMPQGTGKKIEFRRYSSLPKATTPIQEGVTPAGNQLNVTTVEGDIAQYGDWIRLSDMLKMTAIDNNIVQATKILGSQAGRTRDTVVREVMVGGTNVIYAPKGAGTEVVARNALDATCKLTPDLFFKAAAQLNAMNADYIDDSYVAIIHPYAAYDLMRNSEWIDWQKYSHTENLYRGEIGRIANIRFVESSEAKIFKDSSCPSGLAVFATMVVGAHAYGVTELEGGGLEHIVKPLGYGDDPLNQRASVGWKCTMCAERLVEEYMIRVESCGTYSSSASAN